MYIMAEEKIEKYKKFGYFKKIQFDNDKNVCYNLVIHKILKESFEDGTGSRSPSKDVGDVGVPPHLNFL